MAEETMVCCVQNETYAKEMKELKKNKFVSRSSPLRRLDPFLKGDLICVGGIIKHMLKGTSNDKTSFIILKDLDFNNKNMKK